MLYDLECSCGEVSEHWMGMNDEDKIVDCPDCGEQICRRKHRVPNTFGLLGCHSPGSAIPNYNGYYDEGMGIYIRSKEHRAEEMKVRGLTEFNPDPTMQKHRDEIKNIKKHSRPSDLEAQVAIQKERKTAVDSRRTRNVANSLEKSFQDM